METSMVRPRTTSRWTQESVLARGRPERRTKTLDLARAILKDFISCGAEVRRQSKALNTRDYIVRRLL